MEKLTASRIAKMIDHSLLRPEMTTAEVINGCEIAARFNVATVCVRPYDAKLCAKRLEGSKVGVSVVVGFPHGNSTTAIKAAETLKAIDDGSCEIDVVLPIGRIKSADWNYVRQDLAAVCEASHQRNVPVRVIFENAYLTREEIIKCCEICNEVGADCAKTSTGYAPSGSKTEDIILMRQTLKPEIYIKAAGGIRNLDMFLANYCAGATRQGTRSTVEIVEEAIRREREGLL